MIDATRILTQLGDSVQTDFERNKRVLSYADYVSLVTAAPSTHVRNSAMYLRDMFDHFGTAEVSHPRGMLRRFRLFDAPWSESETGLIGQEPVQNEIYRVLSNFVQQGRVDRFILLHGPNGSSKSTITDIIAAGMEQYSAKDEGALYRFNWVFPSKRAERSGIGFGTVDDAGKSSPLATFAHLEDMAIDARLPCELRDHPLLLLPHEARQDMFSQLDLPAGARIPDYLLEGDLSHRNKLVFEALLSAYEGDLLKVLRHVQVERFFVSRRYRLSTARIEPQMAVDARARQVTMDRSFSALPSALLSMSLFDLDGELVRANRGMVDFTDMLKRPLDAFKYLLSAVENAHVALDQANLFLDVVFIGSANETHLNAFMESPQWMSFKARLELICVPYLLDYKHETEIYSALGESRFVERPIAPHAMKVAALWAVLTRMQKPDINRFEGPIRDLLAKLTPLQKAQLYADKKLPEGLKQEQNKLLLKAREELYRSTERSIVYEGRTGASPREVKTAILNATQNPNFPTLSPMAVLSELTELCKENTVYDYLRQEKQGPGYYDHPGFVETVRNWFLDIVDSEVQRAIGLVEEASYVELFDRYITHMTHALRKERLHNPVTGGYDDPDAQLLKQVEEALGITTGQEAFRQGLMSKIGAWSIDNQGELPIYSEIFSAHFTKLRDQYFQRQRSRVQKTLFHALDYLSDAGTKLTPEAKEATEKMVARLRSDEFGYEDHSLREALTSLVKHRYQETKK